MGVQDPPRSHAELRSQLGAFDQDGILERSERTDEVVQFLRRPPLFPVLRAGYPVLFDGAVGTLTERHRELLGLALPHVGPVALPTRPATGVMLAGIGALLGPEPAAAKAARVRRSRLGIADPA